jgi:hypothetical protein
VKIRLKWSKKEKNSDATPGQSIRIKKNSRFGILSVDEVAKELEMSRSWVYRHAGELGASKIGGSWIFTKEGLRHALQRSRSLEGSSVYPGKKGLQRIQNQKRSQRLGSRDKKDELDTLNRHGLADVFKPISRPVKK